MKINKLLYLSVCTVFLTLTFSFGQPNFTVTPQLIELELAPGAHTVIKVLLSNESEKDSQKFKVFSGDVFETEDGNYSVLEKGKGRYSCADWIKLDTMQVSLGPKKAKEIPFDIKVPFRASGSAYASIVFTLLPTTTQMEPGYAGASVTFYFKVPVQVEITIKSSTTPKPKNVEVAGITIKPAVEDKNYADLLKKNVKDALLVTAMVSNGGDIHVKAKGKLILTDSKGRRLREFPLGAGRGMILPKTKVKFSSVIKRPLPGDYIAEALINYGGLSTAIGRVPFSVSRSVSAKNNSFLSTSPIGLTVSRELLDIAIPPNGLRTQVITLRNEEKELIKLKNKLRYLAFDETGNVASTDTGNEKFSCIKWTTIEPNELEIQPGETKTLKVVVKAPDVTPGGRYACISIEAKLSGTKNSIIPTTLQIPIMTTVTGSAEKKGEITKAEVSTSNPPDFTVYFKNIGNIHLRPTIKIELKRLPNIQGNSELTYVGEPKSELVGVFGFKNFPIAIIPGNLAKFEQNYDRLLESGNYMAIITADFGATEPVVFIQKFKIK